MKFNEIDTLVDRVADAVIDAQVEQYRQFGLTMSEEEVAQARQEMMAEITPIVEKINNKWIKFSGNKDNSEMSEQQQCITDAFEKLQKDAAMRDEFMEAYRDNKFIVIEDELGVKNGSFGYVLGYDEAKAKVFGDAAEKTTFIKEIEKCNDSDFGGSSTFDTDSSTNDGMDIRVELWVSQWSHQITAMSFDATDSSSLSGNDTNINLDMTMGYDKTDNLTVPDNAIDANDLLNELEAGAAPAARTASPFSI